MSRLTDRFNALARWDNTRETVQSLTSMKRIAMTWDYPEVNVFAGSSGSWQSALDYVTAVIEREADAGQPATVLRGSATKLSTVGLEESSFDAVITDPPYYDNESYAELSDTFYVWLQPVLQHVFPEHFASQLTPKRQECVAAAYRQGGTKEAAYQHFEGRLAEALGEARRVLKPDGVLTLVYAHRTTAGWATLVNALRNAGFEVTEAWPVETETKSRAAHQGDAALRSSIFIVARPRLAARTGRYENDVAPALHEIASERVRTLWNGGNGLGGSDLLMASVGAGLRPYTRFRRVEYANGDEMTPGRSCVRSKALSWDRCSRRYSTFPAPGLPRSILSPASTSCGGSPTERRQSMPAKPLCSAIPRTSSWTRPLGWWVRRRRWWRRMAPPFASAPLPSEEHAMTWAARRTVIRPQLSTCCIGHFG